MDRKEMILNVSKDVLVEVIRAKAITLTAKDPEMYIAKLGKVYAQIVTEVTKTVDSLRP